MHPRSIRHHYLYRPFIFWLELFCPSREICLRCLGLGAASATTQYV